MSNPAARILENDRETFGSAVEYPYVGTTYSLTEHFHAWTAQNLLNMITSATRFVEISEELAQERYCKRRYGKSQFKTWLYQGCCSSN